MQLRLRFGRFHLRRAFLALEGDVHPGLPSRAVLGALRPRRHRLPFGSDGERRPHADGWRIARPSGVRDVAVPSEMEYAVVIDREPHHLHLALIVEAASEESLPFALSNDLDRSYLVVADDHVHVVHEEVSAVDAIRLDAGVRLSRRVCYVSPAAAAGRLADRLPNGLRRPDEARAGAR